LRIPRWALPETAGTQLSRNGNPVLVPLG